VADNCIGCGACAERCPYGNIQMHPVEPEPGSAWSKLLAFLGAQRPSRAAAPAGRDVARKAVKCDLCAEYEDYACVTACPTGAAFRTDLAEAVGSAGGPLRIDQARNSRT
jgi:Fe-S-cluster-containing hydrogenase component 2